MADQPATPMLLKNTPSASTTSVVIADANPRETSGCGWRASSAALATPSMPRYSQTANGRQGKTPPQPCGSPSRARLAKEKCGAVTATKSNSSPTAATVTISSKAAACRMPQTFNPLNSPYAAMAIPDGGTDGKNRLKYAPIAPPLAAPATRHSTTP